jgi:hypothetical protein
MYRTRVNKSFIDSQIGFAAADYNFWLVGTGEDARPYFFIQHEDSKADAVDTVEEIRKMGYYAKARTTKRKGYSTRYSVFASPKGEQVLNWYYYNKGVNFD